MIYRQWNLYESMCHSRHVAVRLMLWNAQGMKKLETWLAKLGLPLEQVKQPWKAMNPELKTLLPTLLEKKAGELDVDLLFYPSFVRKPMFDKETAASDTVWAVSSLLECSKRLKMQQASDFATGESSASTSSQDFSKGNFWNAYYALSKYVKPFPNALTLSVSYVICCFLFLSQPTCGSSQRWIYRSYGVAKSDYETNQSDLAEK